MENKTIEKKRPKSRKQEEPDESLDPAHKMEARRVREQRERQIHVMDDLLKLRNHYYLEYMSRLTDKVEEQRRDIQEKTEKLNRRILKKELKEKKESHRVKLRNPKSTLSHDNAFLEKLPRSKIHQIVLLEGRLRKEGKLKTLEDWEKFWGDVASPDTLRSMLGGGDRRTPKVDRRAPPTSHQESSQSEEQPSSSSLTSSLTSFHQDDVITDRPMDTLDRGLSQIYEDNESSRPVTRTGDSQSWAVTRQMKIIKGEGANRKSHTSLVPSLREREQDIVSQLAKVEFPRLSCFNLDLEPAEEDPQVVSMKAEYRRKARLRESEKRRTRKMYETSITHQAAVQRIFSKNPELMKVLRGPRLADVIHNNIVSSSGDDNSDEQIGDPDTELLALPAVVAPSQDPREYERENPSSGRTSPTDGNTCVESASRYHSTPSPTPPIVAKYPRPSKPFPLTLESILPNCSIKEAKGLSSMWNNYGKYLPSLK